MAVLTDRTIRGLKPAPPGKRAMVWDDLLPSFGVRITDRGSARFIVMRRLEGRLVRRNVGLAWDLKLHSGPSISLAEARHAARLAIIDITQGVDPNAKKAAEARKKKHAERILFSSVAEDFLRIHVAKLRSSYNVNSAIRRKLIPLWGSRPIADISRSDVIRAVRIQATTHPYAARHLLAYVRKLFGWALAQDCYDLHASPCVNISADSLIGERRARERVLTDAETAKVWKATFAVGLPFGELVRLLFLTGQRLRECAEATWAEFDLKKGLWSIPAERMKNKAAHEVPLSRPVVDLLKTIPKGVGPYVFSTTDGLRPVSGFSKSKARIKRELDGVTDWTFHDIRRTVRTNLGAMAIPPNIAEMVIAHAQPGLHRVYDRHRYLDEKRRALDAWAEKLGEIVNFQATS